MSAMPGFDVFVSYSRHDAAVVTPIVKLLRLGDGRLVFLDVDSIAPGERWREQLEKALAGAAYVVVFWCAHSNASSEVAHEIEAALASGRKLVPVLLDHTALPAGLADYEWIDMTDLGLASHGSGAAPAVPQAPPQAPAARKSGGLFGMLANLVGGWFPPFAGITATRPGPAAPMSLPEPPRPRPEDAMAARLHAELLRRARSDGLIG